MQEHTDHAEVTELAPPDRWYESRRNFGDVSVTVLSFPDCNIDLDRQFATGALSKVHIDRDSLPINIEIVRKFLDIQLPGGNYASSYANESNMPHEVGELVIRNLRQSISEGPGGSPRDSLIDEIIDSPILLIEMSPPSGHSLNGIFQATAVSSMTIFFANGVTDNPLLAITMPAGIVLMSVSLAIGSGIAEHVRDLIAREPKEPKERIDPKL